MELDKAHPLKLRAPLLVDLPELVGMSKWPITEEVDREIELEETIRKDHNRVLVASKGHDIRGYIHHSVNKEDGFVQIENFCAEDDKTGKMLFDKFYSKSQEIQSGMPIRINQVTPELEKLGFKQVANSNVMTMDTDLKTQMKNSGFDASQPQTAHRSNLRSSPVFGH